MINRENIISQCAPVKWKGATAKQYFIYKAVNSAWGSPACTAGFLQAELHY
jgi:hypothetical protein